MKKIFISLILVQLFSLAQQVSADEIQYLWESGAPGFEHLKDEKEKAQDWWVKSVHNPSMTIFLADKEQANGTAVLIFPGGGHRELVFDEEGTKAAKFLNTLGVSAFVLKYRLAREEGSPYILPDHPQQDAQRALHLIRSNAESWNIDASKIGVMGFSAGGEVASMVAYGNSGSGSKSVDFQILIYPGPLGIPDKVEKNAPPTFLLVAADDPCCASPSLKLLKVYQKARASIEAHFLARGGHGFNMGDRSKLKTIASWPQRLGDWLEDSGYLQKN